MSALFRNDVAPCIAGSIASGNQKSGGCVGQPVTEEFCRSNAHYGK